MRESKRPLRIYICGPYTKKDDPDEVAHNIRRAILAGIELVRKGHIPFIPLVHFRIGREEPFPKEFYHQYDRIWLRYCEALLLLEKSEEAGGEVEEANLWGLEIFHSVEEVPEVQKEYRIF